MLRVGLHGFVKVACGKSTIAAMMVKRGAHFLQADGLAHQLYALRALTPMRKSSLLWPLNSNEDGTINRTRLANVVFLDLNIDELNAVVHPEVIKRQNHWMAEIEHQDPHGIAVVEAALLIEAGAHQDFDKVIVVTCDLEHKIEHFARRANLPLEAARFEVERRSAAQFTDAEKAGHADYVIDNSGGIEETQRQVDVIWQALQALPH